MLGGQQRDRAIEIAHHQGVALRRAQREIRHLVVECVGRPRGADFVDVYVMHDRKEPGAQVGPAAIQMQLRPGAFEGVLHQIVGRGAVAHQRASVTPQPRDKIDQALGFAHR